jgi:superfamily II DNA/RNA helicase
MTERKISFADLGLSKEILEKIEKKGYKNPSPIQAEVIPLLLNGQKDII